MSVDCFSRSLWPVTPACVAQVNSREAVGGHVHQFEVCQRCVPLELLHPLVFPKLL